MLQQYLLIRVSYRLWPAIISESHPGMRSLTLISSTTQLGANNGGRVPLPSPTAVSYTVK